ncbi:MAG: hypothetical protein KA066_01195 [Candidatus Pacebacteria bacterium]|nr:hypothetical protein [Candidatus Paceibacterota bacterium]
MYKKLRNTLLIMSLLAGYTAQAQFLPEPVQYIVTPEVPGPNQTVTIEAQGIGAFLGDATISWQKDGTTAQSGTGLRTYTFVTGGVGSVTRVRVDIRSPGNGSFSEEFVFRPSTVSLVWESDTSAPPLFGGKSLYTGGSPLKVVAFPTVVINGARVAPQSLSFQWTRQELALPAQSGLGRNILTLEGDQLQAQENIGVSVYFGTSLVAQGGITIPASAPQILLYERDALRGVLYDSALPRGISLTNKEITVVAEPYYFSNPSLKAGVLQYDWMLNEDEIVGPDSARGILTLRQTGNGEGGASLSVALQNNATNELVQSAQTVLTILFGGQSSGGSLFGL